MISAVQFRNGHDYPAWHEEARCADKPQEWFFGYDNDVEGTKRHRPMLTMSEVKRAIAICDRCPVRKMCLEYALVNHEEYGVWGGTTGRDRQRWWRENDAEWARRDTVEEIELT